MGTCSFAYQISVSSQPHPAGFIIIPWLPSGSHSPIPCARGLPTPGPEGGSSRVSVIESVVPFLLLVIRLRNEHLANQMRGRNHLGGIREIISHSYKQTVPFLPFSLYCFIFPPGLHENLISCYTFHWPLVLPVWFFFFFFLVVDMFCSYILAILIDV